MRSNKSLYTICCKLSFKLVNEENFSPSTSQPPEVNSFIMRQAFGTLMAIEIVNFTFEKNSNLKSVFGVGFSRAVEHESDMQEMLIKGNAC